VTIRILRVKNSEVGYVQSVMLVLEIWVILLLELKEH